MLKKILVATGYGEEWVLHSSPQSVANKSISLLSIVETLLCVFAYWFIWYYLGVTWQHWLIIIATPMVLLRSDNSALRAKLWFSQYWKNNGKPITHATSAVACLTVFLATTVTGYSFVSNSINPIGWGENLASIVFVTMFGILIVFLFCVIADIDWGWLLFISILLSPILSFIILAWIIGETDRPVLNIIAFAISIILSILSAPAIVALGSWVRALLTRCISVLYHPIAGITALPENWVKEILCKDSLSSIELVPEHRESNLETYFMEWRTERRRGTGALSFLTFILFLFIYYTAPLIWRFYIKSTAWFYVPFLWVGRGWLNLSDPDILIWAKSYSRKIVNIFGLLIAMSLLFISILSLIVPTRFLDIYGALSDFGAPMTVLGVFFILDWGDLMRQPWQWFYLPSWFLTVIIFMLVDIEAKEIESGSDPINSLKKLRVLMWAGNFRSVLTNIGILIAVIYFLSAVGLIVLF